MVIVYNACVLDTERIEKIVTPHKGTLEWISKLPDGKPIMESAEEISHDDLDGQGRYIPKKRAV